MLTHLENAGANRLHIAEVAKLRPVQTAAQPDAGGAVFQPVKPDVKLGCGLDRVPVGIVIVRLRKNKKNLTNAYSAGSVMFPTPVGLNRWLYPVCRLRTGASLPLAFKETTKFYGRLAPLFPFIPRIRKFTEFNNVSFVP
jgi:hypothetical protein